MVEISQNFVAFSEGLKFLFQSFKVQSPPPPRQLQDVLASSDLANKFHAYLVEIDEPNEEYTKQNYLNFALKCNELRKADNIKEAENILNSMGPFFSKGSFNNYVDKKGVREGQQKVHACPPRAQRCVLPVFFPVDLLLP